MPLDDPIPCLLESRINVELQAPRNVSESPPPDDVVVDAGIDPRSFIRTASSDVNRYCVAFPVDQPPNA